MMMCEGKRGMTTMRETAHNLRTGHVGDRADNATLAEYLRMRTSLRATGGRLGGG